MKTSIFKNSRKKGDETKNNFKQITFVLTLLLLMMGKIGLGQTATYTIASTSSVTTSGTAPSGSSATFSNTYTTKEQLTAGKVATLTLSGYAGYKITSIVLNMKSNTSTGAGGMTVVAGSTTIFSIPSATAFNNASWYGAWSSTYVNLTKTPSAYDIITGQDVVFTITCSTNSLYITSYTITYEPVSTTPTITPSVASLSGFSYTQGSGPSARQMFTISGANLTGSGNITVNGSTNYEVSTDGTTFGATALYPFAGGVITGQPKTVYVRLKSGLTAATYIENITYSGGGATTVNITCSGSVTEIPTGPCFSENFSGFTTGTHAVPGTVDLSSTINTYTQTTGWSGIKVFSANGEIKLGSSSASGSVTTPTIDLSSGGSVSFDIQVYGTDAGLVQVFHAPDGVTFTQLGSDITPPADYTTQTIPITGGTTLSKIKIGTTQKRVYLDSIRVNCGGTTPTPIITVNPTSLTGFTYVAGAGPSAQQSYTVSGTNLNGSNVTITPSTNYEISQTSGTGFGSTPIILTSFNGISTTIYVRLIAGLAVGTYNSEVITNAGGGATTVNVSCSGNVTAATTPIITVNPTTLTGFTYVAGAGPSAQQSYTVSGTNLNGSNVTITPSTNYEISQTSGTGFGSAPIVLTSFNGTSTTIYVRLKAGLAVGTYNSEIITNAGGGATTVNVMCSGNVAVDVSVEEQISENRVNVFPNPFSEILTIEFLKHTNQSYLIQDAIGRIVFGGTSEKASKFVLNTESLAPGLYILKITSDGSDKVTKVLKR